MRLLSLVGLALLVVSSGLFLFWVFQRRLIYYPDPRPVAPARAVLPGAVDVRFETEDGLKLGGWFVPASEAGPSTILVPVSGMLLNLKIILLGIPFTELVGSMYAAPTYNDVLHVMVKQLVQLPSEERVVVKATTTRNDYFNDLHSSDRNAGSGSGGDGSSDDLYLIAGNDITDGGFRVFGDSSTELWAGNGTFTFLNGVAATTTVNFELGASLADSGDRLDIFGGTNIIDDLNLLANTTGFTNGRIVLRFATQDGDVNSPVEWLTLRFIGTLGLGRSPTPTPVHDPLT